MGYGAPVEDRSPCRRGLVWEEIALKKRHLFYHFSGKKLLKNHNCQKRHKRCFEASGAIRRTFGSPCIWPRAINGVKTGPLTSSFSSCWHFGKFPPPCVRCRQAMQKRTFPLNFPFHLDDDLFLSPFYVFSILIIDSHERAESKSPLFPVLILTFNFFLGGGGTFFEVAPGAIFAKLFSLYCRNVERKKCINVKM